MVSSGLLTLVIQNGLLRAFNVSNYAPTRIMAVQTPDKKETLKQNITN
jgi:hypothetical protein